MSKKLIFRFGSVLLGALCWAGAPGAAWAQAESAKPVLQLSTSISAPAAPPLAASPPATPKPPPSPAVATPAPLPVAPAPATAEPAGQPVLKLGTGDAVTVQVFGRPEFNTTTYVSEDQTILVPLAGPVRVGGLSPADAAMRVGQALREGEFLVNPQVSINFSQFRSQQVSVLGEVNNPGRFSVESKTSVLDLLAQAGGVKESGSDDVTLIRMTPGGETQHQTLNLRKLVAGTESARVDLRGGDSLFVPRADQFYIYGEVHSPNMYKVESNMTVVQAISRSGGLTDRGSDRRIEVKRLLPNGQYKTFSAGLGDPVKPNDVIRVKERIF